MDQRRYVCPPKRRPVSEVLTWNLIIFAGNYREAMAVLTDELYANGNSRAALSLLAYCHYTNQDFASALQCYEQLMQLYPEQRNYHLNYAKCLFQTADYEKALKAAYRYSEKFTSRQHDSGTGEEKAATSREGDHYEEYATAELVKLQAAIKYSSDEDFINARVLIEQIPDGNVDKEANLGCLLYKEKRYEEAIDKFQSCLQVENLNLSRGRSSSSSKKFLSEKKDKLDSVSSGGQANRKPDLLYNLAVCYYQLKRYSEAMKYIGEIIEQGIQDHPELSVGMSTEGIEVRSVGNTEVLHESVLVEAFNLKAAIEYSMKNYDAAREALTDMPPRSEEELDAVTLHNIALLSMDTNPVEGFEKLQFLIGQDSFPPETFANLLLLYCKHDYFELAADLMAENATYTYRYLSPYLYEFLDALITQQTSPEDAYQKFDEIASRHTDSLRRQNKQMQEAKAKLADNDSDGNMAAKQKETLKRMNSAHEETLQLYIPVLMAQAKIYWDLESFIQVEKVFRKSAEFCNELDLWKLNVAHVLFMQVSRPG